MAKPLRTREILTYLLKESPSGQPLYSQREISRTLAVSQTTIHRINDALNNFLASGHSKEELKDKEDFELNRLLLSRKQTSKDLSSNDFEIILKYLEKPEENANSLLKKLQTALTDTNSSQLEVSGFSEEGKNFLKSCSYQTFNQRLHHFCETKGYSDRFIFKPAEYMEIGVIPVKQKAKAKDTTELSLKETGKFIFYAYLPFSRRTKAVLIDGQKSDFTNKIIIFLISFFSSTGIPSRIIGKGRIEEIFRDADLPLIKDYLNFCSLLYSCDRRHSVFESKETELVQGIIKSLSVSNKTDPSVKRKIQDRIDAQCSDHNEKCISTEILLQETSFSEGSFVHNLGIVGERQRNCHVRFQRHWYSSKYTDKTVRLALEFSNGEIYFITKPLTAKSEEGVLSRHIYHEKEAEGKLKYKTYSTNKEDLPPTDEEAKKYGLWTEGDLLLWLAGKYGVRIIEQEGRMVPDPNSSLIKIAKAYIESKDNEETGKYPQQAYKFLENMCRQPDNQIPDIISACNSIVETEKSSWVKSLTGLLYPNEKLKKQKATQNIKETTYDDSDTPF